MVMGTTTATNPLMAQRKLSSKKILSYLDGRRLHRYTETLRGGDERVLYSASSETDRRRAGPAFSGIFMGPGYQDKPIMKAIGSAASKKSTAASVANMFGS